MQNVPYRFQTGSSRPNTALPPLVFNHRPKITCAVYRQSVSKKAFLNFHHIQISEKCVGTVDVNVSIRLSVWSLVARWGRCYHMASLHHKTTRLSTFNMSWKLKAFQWHCTNFSAITRNVCWIVSVLHIRAYGNGCARETPLCFEMNEEK